MSKIDNVLDGLNDRQEQAVKATEGYVRVIAGAGSGKTRALTSRFAYLVEGLGVNGSNILSVTFTNKAAKEMRNRIQQIIGQDNDFSFITTYHGFCVKILREDIHKVHYPKSFVIMDVEDQKTVLRDIYDELGLTSRDYTFKQTLNYIGQQKAGYDYVGYVVDGKSIEQDDKEIHQIYLKYLEKQKRNFALDFDDLLNFVLYIFENNPDILKKWQERLHYIQVDETQDSSLKQFGFVKMLSHIHKNLFVVGDPDQTIYEWRGATPEILLNFDKAFPDSQTIIMDRNYRSTPNILKVGNYIIKNNKNRVNKDMYTDNPNGVDVVHFHGKSEPEESLWVAKQIKKLKDEYKISFADVAILYRAHYVSRSVEQAFIREDIPYTIWGGIRFFERREIKDVLSYLRLIVFGDDISFLRILNRPSRRLGKVFVRELKELANYKNISLYQALLQRAQNLPKSRQGANDFLQLIEYFKERKDELSLSDLIKELLEKSGLKEHYRRDGDEERLENIVELQNSIIALETEDEDELTLEQYLQDIALYTDRDSDDENKDRVKLMTIHTSKGLEFPYVFLVGFSDGILPNFRSLKERRSQAVEEERRLAYVAITRAEKGLYMTESEGFNHQTGMEKHPSRFLFELKENMYVREGVLDQSVINEAKRKIKSDAVSQKRKFSVGDIVKTKAWGKGKIIEVDNRKMIYQIKFDSINAVRPIRYEWEGLQLVKKKSEKYPSAITENNHYTEEEKKERQKNDEDWNNYANEINRIQKGTSKKAILDEKDSAVLKNTVNKDVDSARENNKKEKSLPINPKLKPEGNKKNSSKEIKLGESEITPNKKEFKSKSSFFEKLKSVFRKQ